VAVVVEDDEDVRASLVDVLVQSGFDVRSAGTGTEAVRAVGEFDPVVVTMDVGLPDFDGMEAARRIRMFSDAYLIMISRLSEEADALMGFEAGADDYLTKPFSARELRARVGAMLRRPRSPEVAPRKTLPTVAEAERLSVAESQVPPRDDGEFEHHGLQVHENSRSVCVDGQTVSLTRTQFDLLLVLMENGRTVQTKADLVRRLRNEPYASGAYVSTGEERAVEVHIGSLRKRLGDSSRNPKWIETVWGLGYRLTP
jgi:DNA-binding response OmpR family regulator